MVAAYRIVIEHAPTSAAIAEMLHYHYAHFWLPQLQRYVSSPPKLIQRNSQFSAYALPVGPSTAPKSAMAVIVPATP